MNVIEIFGSIQGEGLLIGTPMVFVRFSGCNLRCRWCDTSYAFEEGRKLDVPTIVGTVFMNAPCKWVCLTGGEPLIQDRKELELLIESLHNLGKHVMVETNGTLRVPASLLRAVDFWSVSPKLSNSGMKDKLNVEALQMFASRKSVQFKFVIESISDIDEVFQTMDANGIHGTVVLQPQGFGDILKTLRKMALYVRANYANRDVRVLPQLHVLMYGHRRSI